MSSESSPPVSPPDQPVTSPDQGLVADRIQRLVQNILARDPARRLTRPILLDEELRELGLSSLEMVNLMLAAESEFDVKIADADMTLSNFRSVAAIEALLSKLMTKS